jgi:hypothetical protein
MNKSNEVLLETPVYIEPNILRARRKMTLPGGVGFLPRPSIEGGG